MPSEERRWNQDVIKQSVGKTSHYTNDHIPCERPEPPVTKGECAAIALKQGY